MLDATSISIKCRCIRVWATNASYIMWKKGPDYIRHKRSGQTYGNFERRVQVCPVCIRNCIYRQVYNLLKTFSHLEEVV